MASVTLSAPTMYADHHVLQVRQALSSLNGVQDIFASAAWQAVVVSYDSVSYDSDATGPAAIQEALTQAGYPPDATTPILATSGERYQDPAWNALGVRVTETNQADLMLSGDFRKY